MSSCNVPKFWFTWQSHRTEMQSEQQMKGLQMSSSSFSLSVGWRNALTEKNKETYNNQIITFCSCSEITGLCIRALVARRDRIVVSTLRCGRSNLGSNPSHGKLKGIFWRAVIGGCLSKTTHQWWQTVRRQKQPEAAVFTFQFCWNVHVTQILAQ